MNETELKALLSRIRPADSAAKAAAKERQSKLAKPPGSLGALEEISVRLAGITGRVCNRIEKTRIVVFAADNGIVAEGVASTPQSVTLAQAINMTRGKTGMSAIARDFGIDVEVIDVGINSDSVPETILDRKLGFGTANFSKQPAMTRSQAVDAIAIGIEAAERAHNSGADALGIGEMGIGNTSSSSMWMTCFTHIPLELCVGAGSGLDNAGVRHKYNVLQQALDHYQGDGSAHDLIRYFGGLEMVMAIGAMLQAAELKMIILVDGFIMTNCILAASQLYPEVLHYAIFGHQGDEAGHKLVLDAMGAKPLLNLGLRLGEGTGAICSYPIIDSAVRMINEMDNFAHAAITKYF